MSSARLRTAALLAAVVFVPAWLWWHTPGSSDVELWLGWIEKLLAAGPRQGYADIQGDYPPGASFVLWICGRVANSASMDQRFVIKLTLLAWLVATTAILLIASRRAALSAFAYAALVLNAFVLMYLDIFTAPFVIGAVWAARIDRLPLMATLLTCAALMKWQPILLLPFAAIYILRSSTKGTRRDWRRIAMTAAIPAALVAVVLAIYGYSAVHDSLDRAGHHNNLSNYAANPLWVLTWFLEWAAHGKQTLSPDGVVTIMAASRPEIRVSSLISLIGYIVVLRKYWKSADQRVGAFIRFSLAGYLIYFLVSVGAHENHLFLASLLGIALAWEQPRMLWAAVVLAIAANLNLAIFYGTQGIEFNRIVAGLDASVVCAIAISIAVSVVGWRLVRSSL